MKRATKKEMHQLRLAENFRRQAILIGKNLCLEILKKNGGKIMLPIELFSSDNNFTVYGKYNSVTDLKFAGAAIVLDELCLYGEDGETGKIELVSTGWYDENELVWIARYLTNYINGALTPEEE